MRLGVLDIGSNSAQLLIVEARPGAPPLPVHAVHRPTRLAEATGPDGAIEEAGVDRVISAVADAVVVACRLEVEQFYPYVTAAIRDASNRAEVLDRIETATGIAPQHLTGEQEARLTYVAVRRWYGWSAGRLLDLDIGGGSMEVVYGLDARPDLAISLPLGAGRLTRSHFTADPPPLREVDEVRRHIHYALREANDRLLWDSAPRWVVGTSKTFKQLSRLAGAPGRRKGPFRRRTLALRDIDRWIPRLAVMSSEERAQLRGISRPRARQILAGAVIAAESMRELGIDKLEICPWALREGIILEHLARFSDPGGSLPIFPLRPNTSSLSDLLMDPGVSSAAGTGRAGGPGPSAPVAVGN